MKPPVRWSRLAPLLGLWLVACTTSDGGGSAAPGGGGSGGSASGGRGGSSGSAGSGGSNASGTGGGGGSAAAGAGGSGSGTGGGSVGSGSGTGGAGTGGSGGGSAGTGGTGGGGGGSGGGAPTDGGGAPAETGVEPTPPAMGGLEQRLVTRAIGLAYYHLCVILPGGGLRCSGDLANAGDPRIHPPGGFKAEMIQAAHNGFCVLRAGNTQALPEPAPGEPPYLAVSVTGRRLTCWGHKNTFFPPANLEMDPIQYGIGYDHGCVLNRDGSVACWGQPGTNFQPPAGLKAKQLTVAAFFNCAIKEDDSVVCWGIKPPTPPAGLKAKILAAAFHGNAKLPEAPGGTSHACAIKPDDSVTCFGTEVEGNLTPPADLTAARDIAVSTWDSCALRMNGEPVCWGRKVYDNFDATRYHRMPPGLRLKGLRASMATYCGIKLEDDTVVCWGDEQHDHITFPEGGVKAYAP